MKHLSTWVHIGTDGQCQNLDHVGVGYSRPRLDPDLVVSLALETLDAAVAQGLDLDTLAVRDLTPNPKPLPAAYRDRHEDLEYARAVAASW